MALPSDPSQWDQNRRDGALIHAADFGDIDDAIQLMQAGANPTGYPLIMAIQAGHPRVVEAMLSFGASADTPYVDAQSGKSYIALIHAVSCRQLDSARLLLDGGADPNAQDSSGTTPLGALATRISPPSEDLDREIRALLVARGAR